MKRETGVHARAHSGHADETDCLELLEKNSPGETGWPQDLSGADHYP